MGRTLVGKKIMWQEKSCLIVGYDPSEPHPTMTKSECAAPYYLLQNESKKVFKVPAKDIERIYNGEQ